MSETKHEIAFYYERHMLTHLYIIPVYMMPLAVNSKHRSDIILVLFMASLVLFLSMFWSLKSKLIQCYKKTNLDDMDKLEKKNINTVYYVAYRNRLCEIKREKWHLFFTHNNQKFLIKNSNSVKPVKTNWEDYTVEQIVDKKFKVKLYEHFPSNKLKIEEKTFLTLYKEQITNPLFCFGTFSSILMLFDDYVMNSLFSILMGFGVEALMTISRLTTIKMFQSYKVSQTQHKLSNNRIVSSTDLKPGDVVIVDTNEPIKIQADFLILDGSAVVNEAMLSGESIPLLKQQIKRSSDQFDFNKHKKYILFSGTELLMKKSDKLVLFVLRTGFETEQGQLLNIMLSSEEISYDKEALKFVFILSVIAIIASILTIVYSKKSGRALFLDVIILFTNSIPFELPLEMGTAIQMAVRSLFTKNIYCLEPHRIQSAGKLDVCCFDKTGTLTDSKLKLHKIVSLDCLNDLDSSMSDESNFNTSNLINFILSNCNDLQIINETVCGDPLDMAIYDHLKNQKLYTRCKREKEFAFQSEKKRQSVYLKYNNKYLYATKGAPEVVREFLRELPDNYNLYEKWSKNGFRVISVAYKIVETISDKDDIKDLEFGAFLLFSSSIKNYAVEMVRDLQNSNHKVVMITGDNIYTAVNIANRLNIKGKAVDGDKIDDVIDKGKIEDFSIFARANPQQKEKIILNFKRKGLITMMVGDGTNDVGALKAADVGIAMLEVDEAKLKQQKIKPVQAPKSLSELFNQMNDESVKPGDASIAAPFTVKSNSLKPIVEIILQGRTSAATTMQMYKILALNSIINAFTMGFLDLFEIKFSEKQMLSLGVLNSLAFNAISRGKTLDKISKDRVINSIFNLGLMMSVFLQGIVHTVVFVLLIYIFSGDDLIKNYFSKKINDEKVVFKPSKLNTAIYALGMVQTIATFAFNYIGRPFREDIVENVTLFLSLLAMLGIPCNILINFHEDINLYFECVDLGDYKRMLVTLCFILLSVTYLIDIFTKKYMLR